MRVLSILINFPYHTTLIPGLPMSKLLKAATPVLFIGLLTGAFFYSVQDYAQKTNANITRSLTQRLQECTVYAARGFQHRLDEKIRTLESMARYMAGHEHLASPEGAQHFVQLFQTSNIRNFALSDLAGNGFSGLGGRVDFSEQPAFHQAAQGKTAVSSGLLPTADGKATLVIGVPIVRNGKVEVVLMAGMSTHELEAAIETGVFDENTYTLIFDADGNILFGSMPPTAKLDNLLENLRHEETHSPDTAAYLKDFVLNAGQHGGKVLHYKDSRRAFYLSHVNLQTNGWHLVSILPQVIVDAQIAEQNNVTTILTLRLMGLAVLLLLTILYWRHTYQRNIRSRQEEYAAAIAAISGGVQKISDIRGSFLFISDNYLKLLGYDREDFMRIFSNGFANTIYEEDREQALITMAEQLDKSGSFDVEYRARAHNGSLIWLNNKGTQTRDEHAAPYIYSIVFDVTGNKEMQQAQRISDERYHFILEQHDITIFEQDMLTGEFYCSTRWMQTFSQAFNILEADQDNLLIPVHPDDREALAFFQETAQQGKCEAEMRLSNHEGIYRWYRIGASPIMDDSGWPIYLIGIITDIDEQKNREADLRDQALLDGATGVYNKRATEQAISAFLAAHVGSGVAESHACDYSSSYALFMIDFDNFKRINDCLGHAIGDEAILAMCRIIQDNFRSTDIVGRIGGDEFLVLCTQPLSHEAVRERAAGLVQHLHTEWGDASQLLELTASVGVACAPDDGIEFAELYRHADEAAYQAKSAGKNKCVFYATVREAGAPTPAGASVVNETIDSEAEKE